jgi:hypothetical protein
MDKKEILHLLKDQIIDVTFERADGTARTMKCTLSPAYLPPLQRSDLDPPDFSAMNSADLLTYCKDDASKWAAAFVDIVSKNKDLEIPFNKSAMTAWFANAIETAHDHRTRKDEDPVVKVWEIGNGWRSFNLNRVIDVQVATP